MNQFIKDYGHCCGACRYYDSLEGFCKKTNSYHYSYDYSYDGSNCDKWKIAEDLIEHRPKKNRINIEKVKLF